jgi:polar amino acid transport system permease protein
MAGRGQGAIVQAPGDSAGAGDSGEFELVTAAPKSADKPDFPWWLLAAGGIALFLAVQIILNDLYSQIFTIVSKGVWITIFVTLVGFALATAFGLLLAVMGLSKSLVLRQIARFYVEIIRGIPILVLLFYIAFVGAPGFVAAWNGLMSPLIEAGLIDEMKVRDVSLLWRAIIALTIGYSAFISEVFRAGILSVEAGQIEAAKALGLTPLQRFRFIVLPQAIRTILPPLGNDFIAMIKDSSLVSVLGVADLTQMGKVYASGSFRFFETYSIVAYVYLLLTVGLSLGLRGLEKRLRRAEAERSANG